MKKLSLLLLVIALVCALFVLTSCGGNNSGDDTNTDTGSTNTDTGVQADEDLQAAYDYVKITYKTLNITTANFEIMKSAPIGDKIFNISWSTDNEAVTITESEDGNFYVVNVPELGDTAINYTLKFSIENEAGEKKMGSFNLTVPAFSVNSHDEYVAAEDGDALIVQGIVTGVISKADGNKENSIYLQDLSGNGGYYVYDMDADPKGTISVGMTVEVRGEKKNYNGTFELVEAVVTVIDSNITPVTPVDFTEAVHGASSLDASELVNKNGMLVTIKGVTILEYNDGNGYHNFQIGNHKSYLRVSGSNNCITKAECATLTENFQKNFYNLADVTGIINVYNGNIYLIPVKVESFTNIVEQEKPADVKVEISLNNTTIPGIIQIAGNTNLPTSFSGFSDVTISWELVDGADCVTLDGSTLAVTIPSEAKTVKLKATATCGDESASKDFEIVVKEISTITIQEALNIGDVMTHNKYTEELYYIVGTIDSIQSGDGLFHGNMIIVDETGKYSINIYGLYDSTGNIKYGQMDVKPLKKDTIKVLSVVGKYSTTVQLKNAKLVDHIIHEDNVGVVDEFTEMSITEALAAEDGTKIKVSGTVSSIDSVWNDQYGNMNVTIVDANGNTLYIYRLSTKVEVGDVITVKGSMTTYEEKRQVAQGGTATITGHDTSYDYVEMSITEALAAADGKNVIVVGTVSSIGEAYNSGYNNISVYIQDEAGNQIYVYRLKGNVEVGTTIKVTGSIATYKENKQIVGGIYEIVSDSGDSGETCEHTYTDGVCDKCGAKDPDYVTTMTITEALAAADNTKVKITGIIIKIDTPYSEQHGNITVTISDASGSTIQLFRLTGNFNVNDIITVTGVMDTYSGSRQIAQGATATKDGTHTCTEYTEATCKELAKCKECGAESGEKADHTYVDGICSVCGLEKGAIAATATMQYSGATTNMTGENDAATLNLDPTIFTVIGNKGGTNNNCGLNKAGNIRLYANTSSGEGSHFTVSVADGYTIKSIKITFVNTTNNKNCKLTVGETSTIFNGSSTIWEVPNINSNSFNVQNAMTGDNVQIHIASVEIVYVVSAE